MKKISCVLVCTALLYMSSYADMINPDGRIGHVSVTYYYSRVQQKNLYSEQDWIYNGYLAIFGLKDTTYVYNAYNRALTVNIPASSNITFTLRYDYTGMHGGQGFYNGSDWYNGQTINIFEKTQQSFSCKVNIFSRCINDLSNLINPDGMCNSFIISPMMGTNITINEDWQNESHISSGLLVGLRLQYIMTNNLTVSGSYVLSQSGSPIYVDSYYTENQQYILTDQTVLLCFCCYLNNKMQSIIKFNPDGSPGTIAIAPIVGYVFSDNKIKGFKTGTDITVTISKRLSSFCSFQFTDIKVKNDIGYRYPTLQKSKQMSLGFGVNVHF